MSYSKGYVVKNNSEDIQLNTLSQVDYERLTSVVASNIKKINLKAKEIDQKVEQFDENQASSSFHEQLFALQEKTSQLCQDTSRHLKQIQGFSDSEDNSKELQRKTRINRLTKEFEETLKSLASAQSKVVAKEKSLISRARLSSQDVAVADEMQETSLIQNTQTSAQATWKVEELQQREESLRKLESDILDVNQIFKDLASMVEEQGATIDSIEGHVESASSRVEAGNKKLESAVQSRSSARKKKFICGLVIALVVILAIAVIIISITLT